MAVYKCKMCGGTLEIAEGVTVCECDYCGTTQTIPATRDEVISNLFNRANNLRMKSEFDKAQEIYEKIVSQDENEAEAYWGIVLCKYGIEYVEDPATFRKVPTCHRTQLESVMTDVDYLAAVEHADIYQRSVYENEARAIDTLQRNILEIVRKEKPFDVFICYKETDENGKRTPDSVIANDIYHQLAQEGIKTFYAAITLEDKLGQEYEPYIFAALTSAKVMLVVGTRPEYFSAVWVKNEWSRFLKLMKTDRSKLLIPCYRDMDAYDLPEEFSHLQAQNMSKIGFVNDIIRGIKKVTVKAETPQPTVVKETVVQSATVNSNATSLLKRAAIFLGDSDWNSANEYCEKVLDIDPENAQAYLYKVFAKLHITSEEEMYSQYLEDFLNNSKYVDNDPDYKKAYRFGDNAMKAKLDDFRNSMIYNGAVRAWTESTTDKEYRHAAKGFDIVADYRDSRERSEQCKEKAKEYLYTMAELAFNKARTDKEFEDVKNAFVSLGGYKDSDKRAEECTECVREYLYNIAASMMNSANSPSAYESAAKAFLDSKINRYKESHALAVKCREYSKLQETYDTANNKANSSTYDNQKQATELFESISDFKDSSARAEECRNKAAEYLARDKAAIRISTIVIVMGTFTTVCAVFLVLLFTEIIPSVRYNKALEMVENGQYDEAVAGFEALGDYKDSADQITVVQNSKAYDKAVELVNTGKYQEAIEAFKKLNGFSDSNKQISVVEAVLIKEASVGDTVQFGDYSWIILEKTDNSALILAEDILFRKAYNDKSINVTWEECTLRKYLNGDFYNTFSDEEKTMIHVVTNKNPDNEKYSTKGGNETHDKIYLLSIDEANTLSKDILKALAWWWLRSRGYSQSNAAGVYSDGGVGTSGNHVDSEGGVRPAMTISWE